ncbi:hypothetical protein FOB31_16215 [Burkholderia multivorans]|nr:hypothetical protein FOB31_16215 [Burkholderia multivorans]QET41330.1 hypothetical protein FOB30_27655 [Burkholderia multivorans]
MSEVADRWVGLYGGLVVYRGRRSAATTRIAQRRRPVRALSRTSMHRHDASIVRRTHTFV